MPKVNKVYSSFYNGVSEQVPELILDTNCKDMFNCLPNIVYGLKKRPPLKFKANLTYRANGKLFHSYDRGEDNEEYLMIATGDYNTPIEVYNKSGTKLSVLLEAGNEAVIKNYLNGDETTQRELEIKIQGQRNKVDKEDMKYSNFNLIKGSKLIDRSSNPEPLA